MRRFGEILRSARLGWTWHESRGFYVRMSPAVTDGLFRCEIARTFEALNHAKGKEFYDLKSAAAQQVLELCEAVRDASAAEYQCYVVNEKGGVTRLLEAFNPPAKPVRPRTP